MLPFAKERFVGCKVRFVGQNPPAFPKIKINSNRAAKGNLRISGASCIIRNEQLRWIMGAVWNLRVSTLVNAELCGPHYDSHWHGIMKALTLFWKLAPL